MMWCSPSSLGIMVGIHLLLFHTLWPWIQSTDPEFSFVPHPREWRFLPLISMKIPRKLEMFFQFQQTPKINSDFGEFSHWFSNQLLYKKKILLLHRKSKYNFYGNIETAKCFKVDCLPYAPLCINWLSKSMFARRASVIETITNKILQYEYQCYETIGQLPKVFLPLKKFTHLMCLKTSFVKGNVEMWIWNPVVTFASVKNFLILLDSTSLESVQRKR